MSVKTAVATFRGSRVPHFQIIKNRNRWFTLSGIFILLSLAGLFFRGLNFSIDFKGGAALIYTARDVPTVAEVEGILGKYGLEQNTTVEILGSDQVNIRTPGTGKTVLALEIAKTLNAPLIEWHVKSTTKALQGL